MVIETTWNKPVYLFVGSYEQELHSIWNELETAQDMTVWVIGAAEGYYACGMAKKWSANVTAYESSDNSRRVLAANIRLKGLQGKVNVRGKCEAGEFAEKVRDKAPDLLLCDIEGGEDEIFSEDILSLLCRTVLVVEMHPPYRSRSIANALTDTHRVQVVEPVTRCLSDYPYQDWIPKTIKLGWLDERRPFPTPWLIALPKKR
jgi:hypothetical protein